MLLVDRALTHDDAVNHRQGKGGTKLRNIKINSRVRSARYMSNSALGDDV